MDVLTQLTGGQPLYSEEFGPSNMRMRHMFFEITRVRAKAMHETFLK
ncbi:hypothetical protein ACFSCX_20820 [Bacillus salitolerans]|uniref:Globin n=1 Tax=Bacillus salitolerans TaxID=1437434 RepID=A0ABW4LUY6_9BACI